MTADITTHETHKSFSFSKKNFIQIHFYFVLKHRIYYCKKNSKLLGNLSMNVNEQYMSVRS